MSNDELAQYLGSLSRQEHYHVDEVLKSSDFETTERVHFEDGNGTTQGPFIRKTIVRNAGLGSAYERIFAEQQAGRQLSHVPIIVECFPREVDLVVVMEFIQGETLQDLVYRLDPSVKLAAAVFPSLCDAVAELHESFDPPLIHRDLKPSNIMVSDAGVHIIDFGIARDFNTQSETDTTHFGTRAYAPPEQFGYGQTTVRSDVYALGMLLYYCLTEQTPTPQTTEGGFDDLRIPLPIRGVLERACAFDPANRFASARDVKAAFESALAAYRSENPQAAPGVTLTVAQLSVTAPDGTVHSVAIDGQPSIVFGGQPSGVSGIQPSAASGAQQTTDAQIPPPFAPRTKHANTNAASLRGNEPFRAVNAASRRSGVPSTLGTVWNILVALVYVLFVAVSLSLAVEPPESMQGYPRWVDVWGYAVFLPTIFTVCGFALLDKRRLRERFPNTFGRIRGRHVAIVGAVVFALTVLFLATTARSVA